VVGSDDGLRQAVVNREVLAAGEGGFSAVPLRTMQAEHSRSASTWKATGVRYTAEPLRQGCSPSRDVLRRSVHRVRCTSNSFGQCRAGWHTQQRTCDHRADRRDPWRSTCYDERSKLAAIALVTTVTPSAVAAGYHNTTATPFDVRTTPFEPLRARVVQTSGTVLSVQHGTATVAIEVQAGDQQLSQGLSTSLLLPKS